MELFKKKFFIFLLFSGTLITISSSSWFSAWLGLEINLIAFIPMIFDYNQISSEASFKYFLVQAAGSIIFIFCSTILSMKSTISYSMNLKETMTFPLLMALLLKMGASPFHFWFPSIINGLSWANSLLLFTWQKLAPVSILSLVALKNNFLMFLSVWPSLITGALGAFNQTSLKKILAYSSIAHLGWMLAAIYLSHKMFSLYFLMYSLMLIILLITLTKLNNNNSLSQMFLINSPANLSEWLIMLNLLSLGGLPPFMGFFPKWMIFTSMISFSLITTMLMITSSLIILFFYLRLTFQSLLFLSPSFKISTQIMNSLLPTYLSLISILFFLMMPIIL